MPQKLELSKQQSEFLRKIYQPQHSVGIRYDIDVPYHGQHAIAIQGEYVVTDDDENEENPVVVNYLLSVIQTLDQIERLSRNSLHVFQFNDFVYERLLEAQVTTKKLIQLVQDLTFDEFAQKVRLFGKKREEIKNIVEALLACGFPYQFFDQSFDPIVISILAPNQTDDELKNLNYSEQRLKVALLKKKFLDNEKEVRRKTKQTES